MKRVVIHASTGVAVGLGHLRRSLSLAESLRSRGASVTFDVDSGAADLVLRHGFIVAGDGLQGDADVVVIDSYTFDDWRAIAAPVVAFEDLGRSVPAALIVNGAAGAEAIPYDCSSGSRLLLGSDYAVLRSAFSAPVNRRHRAEVQRVLITIGGSDPSRCGAKIAGAVARAFPEVAIDFVVGPLATPPEGMPPNVTVSVDVEDMHDRMCRADVAVSGGGQTLYELAATETPTLAIRVATNQTFNLETLSAAGAIRWIGDAGDASLPDTVIAELRKLATDAAARRSMGAAGRRLVDGKGAGRVADAVIALAERS